LTGPRWWRYFAGMLRSLAARPPRIAFGFVPVVVIATVIFWLTAYPSITWWDSSQYSLAAATLGLTGSPGSLLLTLLGWLVTRLPFHSPAHALNLLAGVLAAVAAGLVYLTAVRLTRTGAGAGDGATRLERAAVLAGAALGALSFAFGDTPWEHAIKFTPYILTAVFTGLILWTMLRWWEEADAPHAWRRLAWLGLLIGLDFSVHRTNALLLPGLLAWLLLRRPRTLLEPRAWLGGAGGLAAGLAVQLLVIPIAAATHSVLNMGDPSNWTRFADYVSLQQRGGGFLVQFFPRNAPFWSVQVADLARVLRVNFSPWNGPLGPLGALPGVAGILGFAHLWRRDRRLGIALALVLLLQATMTVLYFNIPAHYFRPLDRHYLPVCVTFGIAVAYGMSVLLRDVAQLATGRRRAVAALGGALLLVTPVSQVAANWPAHDASRRHFAHDFAANLLEGLPRDAILFTAGDNDTFPLWYLQAVEGVRPDVQVVNRPLANTFYYVNQILRRDPSFPLSLSREQRLALGPRTWHDTTLVIPVGGAADRLGLAPGTPVPDTITLDARPTSGNLVLPTDLVLLDILRTNRWRRPICFSTTVSPAGMGWLQPYGRRDGLYWRIVPLANPPLDVAALRTHLLETYTYRGYADPSIRLDPVSQMMGFGYVTGFRTLIQEEREHGTAASCRETATKYLDALPWTRVGNEVTPAPSVERMCGSGPGDGSG
jgi:hypothetical protein